jgi:phospholipid-translocating ATPase
MCIELCTPSSTTLAYDVLEIFPFTSESKRMGIVVHDTITGEFSFLKKGADIVMVKIVQRNDLLKEETANTRCEGLCMPVVAHYKLSEAVYEDFKARHHAASMCVKDCNEAMGAVVAEMRGLTRVEDKLQDDVCGTLELSECGY